MNAVKKIALGLSCTAALALATLPAQAADYVIDTKGAHASVNFAIQHLGYSWLTGRFNTFSGDFSYDAAKPEASKINVTIDMASIDSNHAERDKHIRSSDFLNTDKNKQAVFESTGITNVTKDGGFDLNGNLTMNGATKPITIAVTKVGEGKDPWGGYRVGFSGEITIKPSEWGYTYNLGPASETVKLWLNVEGIRK
ncbi:YceI family protein [Simiduia agarivorans]|uniref:YceI-like protein, ycel3 n=1 Tax=Simiduia agarivorans (strain DSM 21679 / JCM 13881 / BCRC 17597 / SA1) TaxID=1117647 RepID=K4KPS4_SIMAS|nr:YceI family protein [Simiduia agarivorans]AFV00134.1 yceI-like protein, ycel3 [Simiduia agarivorans SA1 = DSM 21679]